MRKEDTDVVQPVAGNENRYEVMRLATGDHEVQFGAAGTIETSLQGVCVQLVHQDGWS